VTGPTPAEVGGAPYPACTQSDANASAKAVRTFAKGDWKVANGWVTMRFKVKAANDRYFRLRGADLAPGSTNPTDTQGNPLIDELDCVDDPNPKTGGVKAGGSPDLIHGNTPENCWADLRFSSDPVRVDVR